jgi:two-component sensor histidine kinase
LSVWNSGNPVPAGFDPKTQSGLGLQLIYGLTVERYRGTFVLRAEAGGNLAEVTVPREALLEG